jgi:cell division protein YceG involved in septum cleavage
MSEYEIKETPELAKFAETGAVRSSAEGRGRYDLVPQIVIDRFAKHLEKGAKKYTDNNWQKGMNIRRCLSSLLRHAFQVLTGDETEDHLAAIIFNAGAVMFFRDKIKNGERPESLEDLFDDDQFRRYYGRDRTAVCVPKEPPAWPIIKNTTGRTISAGEVMAKYGDDRYGPFDEFGNRVNPANLDRGA